MIEITIKKIIFLSSVFLCIMIITLVASIGIADKSEREISEAQEERRISLLLAEELRESSRRLTEAVQKFVVTGDEQYAAQYMDVALTRSGSYPRPDDAKIAPGQSVPLNELMMQANYSEQELMLLQQSNDLSDNLILLEIKAMNAVRGLFWSDSDGDYSIRGEPNKQMAMDLVFNPNYEEQVNMIMEPFSVFNEILDTRLDNAVAAAQRAYDSSMRTVWIILCVMVAMFVSFLLMIGFIIVRPILMCDVFAKQIADGNLSSDLSYFGNNEIGSLANSLRSMVRSLLERIYFEEHSRYFNAVIALANAGVVIMDENGLITDWNMGAENILGYSADEVVGKSRGYYTPDDNYGYINMLESRLKSGESIERMDVVRKHKDGHRVDCSASYTPIFDSNKKFMGSVSVFHDITDKKQMETAFKQAVSEIKEKHDIIVSSIAYASKIQRNLLPSKEIFESAFSDYSVIWKPRDIVGGDIYWAKNFDGGTILCVCDCTGHGTPGALLTMLVISAFEATINEDNYKNTADVIWKLEQRIVSVFQSHMTAEKENKGRLSTINDGCDIAALYIAKDGSVTISSGNIHVFVCDGNEVSRIKGQKIFLGEGRIKCAEDVQVTQIPPNPNNKFYIASDGLYDQIGGERELPFGYGIFKRVILENHRESHGIISEKIWEAFENHRGEHLVRDDIELITFSLNVC